MNNQAVTPRDLKVTKSFNLASFLVSWEMVLIYLLIGINLILMAMRPDLYYAKGTITSIIQSGMDLSVMVLGMAFILMLGDIDVSVASIMVSSAATMGILYQSGFGSILAILGGLIVGALCGLINGYLVAKFRMPSVIVTIATSLVFRGIVKIVLSGSVLKQYPSWFSKISWGNIFGIPISLIIFLVFGAVFSLILHRSRFGRKLYLVGNSPVVSQYSGIKVSSVKIIVFVLMGIMAGVAAIFFAGRLGGINAESGRGAELNVIAIAVLGGISTNGGKGKMYGPIIATVIMAFLTYTLGLLGVESNTRTIVTGIILIGAVFVSNIDRKSIDDAKLNFLYGGNKNIMNANRKMREEVALLNAKIKEIKSSADIPETEKNDKIQSLTAKITAAKAKYNKIASELKDTQKKETAAAKARFK